MKINPGFRSTSKEISRTDHQASDRLRMKNFPDMMQKQQQQSSQEQLAKQIEQIHVQGNRLMKSMTIRELHIYKNMLRHFLENAAKKSVGMKDIRGIDRRGRGKRYKLLKEIDQQLMLLSDELLQKEQGRVELLDKVGEIKGLLINYLY